jgi:antitoxin FitA
MAHIQIRNVPPDVHRTMKERARKAGMSLQEYLLSELSESAATPTIEEWLERVRTHPPVKLEQSAADIIRAEREERDRRWDR